MSDFFMTPWTVASQDPLSMGSPREEYWNGLPFFSPGCLPDPEIKPTSPGLAGEFFTTEPSGKLSIQRHLFILHCQLSFAESFFDIIPGPI